MRNQGKLSKAAIGVGVVSLMISGFLLFNMFMPPPPYIIFEKYEILDLGGQPVIRVFFSSMRYPVSVELFYEGRSLDRVVIKNPDEVPALLFFNLQPWYNSSSWGNVLPGNYSIVLTSGDYVLVKEIRLRGPKVVIQDVNFTVEAVGGNLWRVANVSLTLNNKGDCPAYIYYIMVISRNTTDRLIFYPDIRMGQGDILSLVLQMDPPIVLNKPGVYRIAIEVSLGFTAWSRGFDIEVGLGQA